MDLHYSQDSFDKIPLPAQALKFPELRYMESKHRRLPWIHGVLRELDFDAALLKTMGKQVIASDFLNFPAVLAQATLDRVSANIGSPAQRALARAALIAPA